MQAIYIPHLLQIPNRTQTLLLDDFVSGLDTLTPVRGKMLIRHGGTFLEIGLRVETIMTLSCDRCLQQYNHRLTLDTSEIIWLDKNADLPQNFPQEREIAWEDLSETLSPEGHFDPNSWLYEQLSLAIPLRQLCGKDCQAPRTKPDEKPPIIDSRWSSLESLKGQLPQ
ncbi:YceD family protein [Crocosphaera sp. XPORK-15E]|uniref:YceD family protein n=1 Tax=Crocosphaera sp. XPORK-15E TaxID=3110247 RepID=UPI002B1FB3E6|nr:YceD family protein [Crocosphaera sp. XPORK-15E]MEA5535566.1 YceD family protein [Crocosphaera sp. XPORK-15E]